MTSRTRGPPGDETNNIMCPNNGYGRDIRTGKHRPVKRILRTSRLRWTDERTNPVVRHLLPRCSNHSCRTILIMSARVAWWFRNFLLGVAGNKSLRLRSSEDVHVASMVVERIFARLQNLAMPSSWPFFVVVVVEDNVNVVSKRPSSSLTSASTIWNCPRHTLPTTARRYVQTPQISFLKA